jgi:hypothetical protein
MHKVHYNINFEILSQRFTNDNILEEQACAKKKLFIVAISKCLDFVMFESNDLMHISAKLKIFITFINYQIHVCPIFQAENSL